MNNFTSPKDFLAVNRVNHEETADGWRLQVNDVSVVIPKDLRNVQFSNKTDWELSSAASSMKIAKGDKRLDVSFSDAKNRHATWEEFGAVGGWRICLDGFAKDDVELKLGVVLFIGLDWQTNDILLEFRALENQEERVKECRWPGGFAKDDVETTVLPFMQGMLIPKDWPREIVGYPDALDPESNIFLADTRILTMPWWGVENHGSAAMMIIETHDDFGVVFHHPAGGPTQLETRFIPQLGEFRYARRIRIKAFAEGNYVTMAKAYREHAQMTGHFMSLQEKIARSPKVAKMIGSAVIHTGILYWYQPDTRSYNHENLEKNYQHLPPKDIIDKLGKLYDNGLRDAYMHLDGWGFWGYDSLEPDSIPIGEAAGGADGVKAINEKCHEQGYLFALHQQYRDYYDRAAGYNDDHRVRHFDGSRWLGNYWCGGYNGFICNRFSPEFVRRNNRYFAAAGLQLDGTYLDVFSVVQPDECTHPEHPVTRTEAKAYRAECFGYIRHAWGIVSSEEGQDWTIPYIDMVHHLPFSFAIDGSGDCQGVPVPLFNLVYHDALITPWASSHQPSPGSWIPKNRIPYLCGLLNAGIPYVSLDATAEDIADLQPWRELNKRVALLEMTDHRFLSDDRLEEETTFADGTRVHVNHRDGTWNITAARS